MISDTSNTETPKKEKKTYTVEEIAEQLCVSKKVAYALVKSGKFAYVRAGRQFLHIFRMRRGRQLRMQEGLLGLMCFES